MEVTWDQEEPRLTISPVLTPRVSPGSFPSRGTGIKVKLTLGGWGAVKMRGSHRCRLGAWGPCGEWQELGQPSCDLSLAPGWWRKLTLPVFCIFLHAGLHPRELSSYMLGHLGDPHTGSGENRGRSRQAWGHKPVIITTKEAEAGGDNKFKAYLGYKSSSRVTWAS